MVERFVHTESGVSQLAASIDSKETIDHFGIDLSLSKSLSPRQKFFGRIGCMSARSASGDGSCRPIKEGRFAGKWRVQIVVQDAKGAKKRLSRIFPSQRDGKDFIRSLQRDSDRASIEATREMTLGQWFRWLVDNEWTEGLDSKTVRSRVVRFEKYVEQEWGGVPLTKIDPIEVKAFYKNLREDGIGHATREAIKGDLVRAFNLAISPYKRVPTIWGNPFRLPMDSAPTRDAVALTPDQARKALKSKKLDDKQRSILGVLLLGGLRLSEMMALTKRQLNFKEGLILVDQAVHLEYGGAQSVTLPKGGKIRSAVMCDGLKTLLEPFTSKMEGSDFVFSATTGNQPRAKNLVYATWRTIVRDASLPASMTPHDCRLTHINWIEKLCPEVSVTTLKEHIGHAGSGVTEVNYTRPLSTSQTQLANAIDSLLNCQN